MIISPESLHLLKLLGSRKSREDIAARLADDSSLESKALDAALERKKKPKPEHGGEGVRVKVEEGAPALPKVDVKFDERPQGKKSKGYRRG